MSDHLKVVEQFKRIFKFDEIWVYIYWVTPDPTLMYRLGHIVPIFVTPTVPAYVSHVHI